jgi:hypothetical protein
MAIKRTDTPLATTSDPKAIDPVVKSKSTDPDTGVTTYKHTWSNTYGKKSAAPTTRTTTPLVKRTTTPLVKRTTAPVKKESSSSLKVPQERTFTSLPSLTPAGRTDDAKPTAPTPKLKETSNEEIKKGLDELAKSRKYDQTRRTWSKSYDTSEGKKKGQDFDTWYKEFDERTKKQSAKNRRWDWLKGDGGAIDTGKNKGTTCRTC